MTDSEVQTIIAAIRATPPWPTAVELITELVEVNRNRVMGDRDGLLEVPVTVTDIEQALSKLCAATALAGTGMIETVEQRHARYVIGISD